jgi:hypothetical protein
MLDRRPVSWHAIDRCRERYGVRITPEDLARIEDAIASHAPEAIRLGTTTTTGSPGVLWAVRYHVEVKVYRWLAALVIDGSVVTFYPRTSLDPYRKPLRNRKRLFTKRAARDYAAWARSQSNAMEVQP